MHVVSGMGGVGKTSLARAYAQRHCDDYGVVWWVRAEDPGAIDAEFRSLLEILLPPGEATKVGDARTAAFALLANQDTPWLLVLDNVPDPASAHGLLPPAGDGHVLITSRATGWPDQTTVQPLDTGSAIELLISQSGDGNREAAEVLAAELGGLPLALTQAAGFARTNAIDLATYLRLYRDRGAELHDEGRPADYPHTVATTWQLAMDHLTANARELLNLIAFYAPDAIPVGRLLGPYGDELLLHRGIGELLRYSLVVPAGAGAVTVHRLVQAVTRDRLGTDRDSWANFAHKLIIGALPKQSSTAGSLATWNTLRTHVLALFDHLPPDRPDILATWSLLANWTGQTGDVKQARELLADLLPIQERVLGAEHTDTVTTRANLAYFTGELGDAARARDLYTELLRTAERVSGADHPKVLAIRSALAKWTGKAGDPARARDLFAELLPVVERVLGAEHADTLITRSLLATWTGWTGNADRAREQFTELVPMMEDALGAEDPITLVARNNLANWTGHAGDAAHARDLVADLLPTAERVLGAENPDTLSIRINLAEWSGKAGDPARARSLFAELLPVVERVLGAEHPETLLSQRQLRHWTESGGA